MTPELLGQLIDLHAAALTLFARQWCAAAEDVVQEAFVKLSAQRPLPKTRSPGCFGWCAMERRAPLRAERRRRRHEMVAAAHRTAWFAPSEDAVIDGADAAAALETLPIEEREVVVAHLWGGLTFEQIGRLGRRLVEHHPSALSQGSVHIARKVARAMPESIDPRLNEVAAALASLAPRPAALDRDRLLFRAGRASAPRPWFWRAERERLRQSWLLFWPRRCYCGLHSPRSSALCTSKSSRLR